MTRVFRLSTRMVKLFFGLNVIDSFNGYFLGYGEADFTEDSKENMLRGKFSYPSSEVAQKPPSHVMTSGPTRPVGGPTPKMTGAVGGKRAPARGHKKDSSPNTSMFSCESNGTFYTELPSTFTATPSPEKVVKKCFR